MPPITWWDRYATNLCSVQPTFFVARVCWLLRAAESKHASSSLARKRGNGKTNRGKMSQLSRIPRLSRTIGGFPDRVRSTLKYVELSSLNISASGVPQSEAYGLNCLYDPYLSVGGHQPSNFDNWTRLYDLYTVVATKIKMSYFTPTPSSGNSSAFGFLVSTDATPFSTLNTTSFIMEQPLATYSEIPAGIVNGPITVPIRKSVQVAEFFGGDVDQILTQPEYTGTALSNPPVVLYCHAWAGPINLASTPIVPTYFKIEFEYDVIWSKPRITLPS